MKRKRDKLLEEYWFCIFRYGPLVYQFSKLVNLWRQNIFEGKYKKRSVGTREFILERISASAFWSHSLELLRVYRDDKTACFQCKE